MITAHILSLDATLIANNMADFQMYQKAGLRLENRVH